jgi:predicted GNAT family acetyltransferase
MRLVYSDKVVGEIDNLPGCSQVAVFHSAFVHPDHRGSGYGAKAHTNRLQYAKHCLYDYTLCTVCSKNAAQIKILEENGWKKLDSFLSTKTGNIVFLYGKNINE